MGKKLVPIFIGMITIGVLGLLVNGLSGKVSANPGDPSIDFELKDMNGVVHQLSDYKGKPVVINFFTTWCEPCLDEAPELEAFGTEYDGAVLLVLAKGESKRRMTDYIEESKSKLTYLLDTKEDVANDYGVIGQPETIIIDENGLIHERFSGPTTKADLIQMMESMKP
ncbi:TlpA family protein disulfide reductase [Cytobacillus spongiae]|uniref:TlpA family protein disulfide reductase n=1 Tax=Cytobacillus spongiae TaxID=2901381 RepID=UPI001F21B612|nr:TlpA disulfide reductase family protein [Cytobacillus spongiae]UII55269.1 TlpA family protein disulfide reductase [Cytobacillus spongiae]